MGKWTLTKSFSRVKTGASSKDELGVASVGDEEGDEWEEGRLERACNMVGRERESVVEGVAGSITLKRQRVVGERERGEGEGNHQS